jgi:hypothetical protein
LADPVVLTKSLVAAVSNTIALNQVPVSGFALTINGASATNGVATLDTARRVLLTYGLEANPRTLVVSGMDYSGNNPISETLNVPAGASGSVYTNQDFLTVTSAIPAGGGWSAGASLGTNTIGSTPYWIPNYHITPFEVAVAFAVLSGAVTASVEIAGTPVLAAMPIYNTGYSQVPPVPSPIGWPGMTGLVGAANSLINLVCTGIRLTITAGAGVAQLGILQAGIRN